jgi:hypothetical protein
MMQESKTTQVVRGQRKECKFGLASFLAVFAYYETDWDKDGLHWAAFGMEDVIKLANNTNSLVERFNLALNTCLFGAENTTSCKTISACWVLHINEHCLLDCMRKVGA